MLYVLSCHMGLGWFHVPIHVHSVLLEIKLRFLSFVLGLINEVLLLSKIVKLF